MLTLPKFIKRTKNSYHTIKPYVAEVIFTPDECKILVEAITSSQVGNREFIPGKEGKDSSRYDLDSTKYAWVYARIYEFMLKANKENFGLDPNFCLSEPVYLNEYKGKEYCGWHTDGFISDGEKYLYRKLTCVIQMSEPKDYTGGDFELFSYHAIHEDIRPIGTAYIIPAFEWHRVTPIESGTRRSLIMFLEGTERLK
jgi:PKHD-type hydroxylase